MFEGLKRKYINWQISGFASDKKYRREKKFINWQEVQDVQILIALDSPKNGVMDDILKCMAGKNVSVWCYISQNNYVRQDSEKVTYLNPKSISFLAKPNKIIIGKFIKETPDVLLDLTMTECFPLKYLAGASKAHCKCGISKEDYSLYDLEIRGDRNMSRMELLEQIMYYLNTIQSKK